MNRSLSIAETAAFSERNSSARDYVNWIRALVATRDGISARATLAPNSKALPLLTKAAVAPGTTVDSTFGEPLSPLAPLAGAFLATIRPNAVVGQMRFRRVPFNVKVPASTAAATAAWVGENSPAPLSSMALESLELNHAKLGAIIVASQELARSSAPDAMAVFEAELGGAVNTLTDTSFLDPTSAGIEGVTPAAVTYGAPSITASGTTADAFRADARLLLQAMLEEGGEFAGPLYWVMDLVTFMSLALLDGGGLVQNGAIGGVPVIVSNNAPSEGSSPDGRRIYLIDAGSILFADDGLEVDLSRHSTLQMDTAPDSPVTASTVMVGLWQRNLVALRITRFCRWLRRSAGAAGYINDAAYGS